MNRARSILLLLGFAALPFLAGCANDGRRDTFSYLRTPVTFTLEPVTADHPFCQSADTRLENTTEAECLAASKYKLRWNRPEDTVGFMEYRIYVDTTPPNSVLPWAQVRKTRALASFILEGAPGTADSAVFVLADSGDVPAFLSRDSARLMVLDTTGRRDSGRIVFAIVTAYRESGLDGQPRITLAITDDRFAPATLQPRITPGDRSMMIEWARPLDATSFFEPTADTGVIRSYRLRVVRGGIQHSNRPGGLDNAAVTYVIGGADRTAEVVVDTFRTLRHAQGRLFRLPDGHGIRNRAAPDPLDSIRVFLTGLTPLDTLDVTVWAVDSSGNANHADTLASAFTRVLLTDTTKPVTPVVSILDSSRNGFVYAFTASRDLVETGSGLAPAPTPNANILEYRVSRRRIGGSAGGAALSDTVIPVTPARRGDTLFTDTVRHLPPGAEYRLHVRAVDSSGHASDPDSVTVSTPATRFTGPDSALACPPGFVAAPGGWFLRGDTTTVSTADEKPADDRYMQSFCIEPYEHRDSAGKFAVRRTWQQAHDVCRDLALSMSPADSTWLCTEAEWERACEGTEPDVPLVYGMQSERGNPSGVRFACNVGTGDSLMAMTPALRDPSCISYDGVFDMAGNLAEWVLDGHTLMPGTGALAGYPATPDTLLRGVPHTSASTGSVVRGFRGSHYLNPNQAPTVLLARARCSNRDYATQSRPRAFAGCVAATGPQLVVTYNNAAKPPRCLPLPDSIPATSVAQVSTARDSSQILLLLHGVAQPVVYQLPPDTTYIAPGLRPVTAGLTQWTLAVVAFENTETLQVISDTLHAAELLSASPEGLDRIFQREAAPPWRAVKTGGQYAIQYLYAHAQTRNTPAKAYYSNAALGFRCCAKPRP